MSFLDDAIDFVVDIFDDWFEDIIDWLVDFASEVFDFIASWWSEIFDDVSEITEKGDEGVVIDVRTPTGGTIFEQICKECPQTTNINRFDKTGKIVCDFNPKDGKLHHVTSFQAKEVGDTNTDFDRYLAENGGIIRLTN